MQDLIAVDIGNSRIKIGRFGRAKVSPLPEPSSVVDLPIVDHAGGSFDMTRFEAWLRKSASEQSEWLVATVHRTAAQNLVTAVNDWAQRANFQCRVRILSFHDVLLPIRVESSERVGIDRLLGAMAANQLRRPDRAAIIVDLGTAITVDLLSADGAFDGGAILPGITMSARALSEQTDALPHVAMEQLVTPPSPLGKSTEGAIQAGLYWGAVGAIREFVSKLSVELSHPPELFVTGGASQDVAESLAKYGSVRHVPHLVLAGIALVGAQTRGGAGG